MTDQSYNLAIETSTRDGSVALGRGDDLIEAAGVGRQQRHVVALMPKIDELMREHGATPDQLGELYISIGPGSFTGLRVAVTIAKMLARVHGSKIVAVPTLEAVAANVSTDHPHLAVCLNAKGGRCFTGLFNRTDDRWQATGEAELMTPKQVAQAAPRPLAMVGDQAVGQLDWPADVQIVDPAQSVPVAKHVWRLGRAMAGARRFVDPYELTPLYVRLPDAEEKWQQGRSD
jgi:tRNA threonylcarbamoyladenosine biosynthesis protein TsaB